MATGLPLMIGRTIWPGRRGCWRPGCAMSWRRRRRRMPSSKWRSGTSGRRGVGPEGMGSPFHRNTERTRSLAPGRDSNEGTTLRFSLPPLPPDGWPVTPLRKPRPRFDAGSRRNRRALNGSSNSEGPPPVGCWNPHRAPHLDRVLPSDQVSAVLDSAQARAIPGRHSAVVRGRVARVGDPIAKS